MLEGANTVKGGYQNYPGVYVPADKTLTIDGEGSLDASSNGYGCGIGGGFTLKLATLSSPAVRSQPMAVIVQPVSEADI